MKKSALGRGLDALLGEVEEAYENESSTKNSVVEIALDEIEPNPYQPRKHFSNESLKELAESIKKDGLIQPVIVVENSIEGYTLVAGERRFRASKLAKLSTIKAIVLDITQEQMQQYALIENIQREDLNPIELAQSYQALIELHNVTHEELASIIHKSRTHITNTLRLLHLSKKAQDALVDGKISAGHAKMLVGLDEKEQKLLVDSIIGQKLSVRDVEKMVKSYKQPNVSSKKNAVHTEERLDFSELKKVLSGYVSSIKDDKRKITLEFEDQEQVLKFIEKIS